MINYLNNKNKAMMKKGQIAVFVVVAIAILAIILVIVFNKESVSFQNSDFQEVYDYYASCIEDYTNIGIELAGTRGGRIYDSDFEQASDYSPFSSNFNFLGETLPYWYYLSGNGISRINPPSKSDIESDIEKFITNEMINCDFSDFYEKGYEINRNELKEKDVNVQIEDNKVLVNVQNEVSVKKGDVAESKKTFNFDINNKLGKNYELAKNIFDKEMQEMFLEGYALDVLRLYAPVDGVELSCSPEIWKTREVADSIKQGLEGNIASIKLNGNYYELNSKEKEYFVMDVDADTQVNFMYNKEWPSRIEIYGSDDELLIAKPVGNQEGMGILGFCYAPYHFVYDVYFPVLVQVIRDDQLFQFPVVVLIDKNLARDSYNYNYDVENKVESVCEFNNQQVEIRVLDNNYNPLNADLDYLCFDERCSVGKTEDGAYIGNAPSCYNGYIRAKAEGYLDKKQLFSTNFESLAEIFMERLYENDVKLDVGGNELNSNAIISFEGDISETVFLPSANKIKLVPGLYNVSVYVYGNSSVKIPSSTKKQCVEVARTGLFGIFGGTKEECYDIEIPETNVESALIGGGKKQIYILEDDLKYGEINLKVQAFKSPTSLEDLQYNYEMFDQGYLDISFGGQNE